MNNKKTNSGLLRQKSLRKQADSLKGTDLFHFYLDVSSLLKKEQGETEEEEIEIPPFKDKEIKLKAPIRGRVVLTKTSEGLIVDFEIKTKCQLICQRCLKDFFKDINLVFSANFSKRRQGLDPYIILSDQTIDLGMAIREEILLSFPYKILCRKDCQGLCPKCGLDLNKGKCRCR